LQIELEEYLMNKPTQNQKLQKSMSCQRSNMNLTRNI